MEIIRGQVDSIKRREERTRLTEALDEDEESFEEVVGSGLTSATASKVATPRRQPKTVPGVRISQPKEKPKPGKDKVSKVKTRKKTGKTEVSLENEETTQTVITQIEFLMPKTSQEFEKQLANMKHIPQATKPPPSKFKIPATLKETTQQSVALPPLIANDKSVKQKLKHQFQAEYDKFADKEFYKDFRFTFIPLPVPTEKLPRK